MTEKKIDEEWSCSDKVSKEQIEKFQKELNEGRIKNIKCPHCSILTTNIPRSAHTIICYSCKKEIDFRKLPALPIKTNALPIKNKAKEFLINFFLPIGVKSAIKKWLDEVLKPFTPSSLSLAIIDDDDLWAKIPEDLKIQTQQTKWAFNEIDTDYILQLIKEEHIDLYSTIINTPRVQGQPIGPLWIHEQINNIKNNII